MPARSPRPNALYQAAIMDTVAALQSAHSGAGIPFKELELAIRPRLQKSGRYDYRALTDALNSLVAEGAIEKSSDNPVRLKLTPRGRARLSEYSS